MTKTVEPCLRNDQATHCAKNVKDSWERKQTKNTFTNYNDACISAVRTSTSTECKVCRKTS